jgi:predicted permease
VPLSSSNEVGHVTILRPQSSGAGGFKGPWSQFGVVLPGYFQNLGIPLVWGRDFSPADRRGSNPVLIIDDTLAHLLWPHRNPIGERVDLMMAGKSEVREVVGVARSVRLERLQESPQPYFYLPFAQHYEPSLTLQVKTAGDPLRVAPAVRAVLRRLDPSVATEMRRFDDEVQEALTQSRLFSWSLGSFSLTALLITAIGLYGTLAFMISRRIRELGIRTALGARSSEIVTMVLRRGLALTLTGIVLGLTAAIWTTSVFSSLLFGVAPTDPAVFASMAFLLMLVGLAASSLPAYSAGRIDPMAIIRHE